eukprot:6870448-Heterocapsa_arctica.AAC.1
MGMSFATLFRRPLWRLKRVVHSSFILVNQLPLLLVRRRPMVNVSSQTHRCHMGSWVVAPMITVGSLLTLFSTTPGVDLCRLPLFVERACVHLAPRSAVSPWRMRRFCCPLFLLFSLSLFLPLPVLLLVLTLALWALLGL